MCYCSDRCVTLGHMKEAINTLQCEKQDNHNNNNNMTFKHFINATDYFYDYMYLSVLFSKYLLYCCMPAAMLLSNLNPIPKDNNDIEKYRCI